MGVLYVYQWQTRSISFWKALKYCVGTAVVAVGWLKFLSILWSICIFPLRTLVSESGFLWSWKLILAQVLLFPLTLSCGRSLSGQSLKFSGLTPFWTGVLTGVYPSTICFFFSYHRSLYSIWSAAWLEDSLLYNDNHLDFHTLVYISNAKLILLKSWPCLFVKFYFVPWQLVAKPDTFHSLVLHLGTPTIFTSSLSSFPGNYLTC